MAQAVVKPLLLYGKVRSEKKGANVNLGGMRLLTHQIMK